MIKVFRILTLTSLILASPAFAKKFKIGTMVPDGTTWAKNLRKMAQDIKKQTSNRVNFKLYLGGVAGDEPDVERKIRSGQFHGGIFTGKALGQINGDVRLLEVPFNFKSRSKAQKVLKGMSSFLDKGFNRVGYESLGYFELGKVYIVSKEAVADISSLKGISIWAWQEDVLIEAIMKNLKLVSVPLALPDVNTSLSTGAIKAAYATPLGIIALQWQSKVKYLLDFPVTYSFGGLLIGDKAWKKISKADQLIVKKIAKAAINKTNDDTIKENSNSLTILRQQGIKFMAPKNPSAEMALGQQVRSAVLKELTGKGKLFTPEGRKEFDGLM